MLNLLINKNLTNLIVDGISSGSLSKPGFSVASKEKHTDLLLSRVILTKPIFTASVLMGCMK